MLERSRLMLLAPPPSPDVLASPAYAVLSRPAQRLLVELEAEILQQGMIAAVSRNGTWNWGNSMPLLSIDPRVTLIRVANKK